MLVSHGSADEQVGFDVGAEAVRLLRSAGADVRFETHEGLEHVASGFGPGRAVAADFLANSFAAIANASEAVRDGRAVGS